MKLSRYILLAAAALAAAIVPALSFAGTTPPFQMRNFFVQGYADATAGSTFNSTTYADLPAATTSVTPSRDPNMTVAPGTPSPVSRIHVIWSADVSKATTTTGTCGVYVNGALLALSARSVDVAAKQATIGGFVDVANTTTGTQTVKLQCKSGDTAVFTVNNANIYVETIEG